MRFFLGRKAHSNTIFFPDGRKGGMLTEMILWGMIFFLVLFATPIIFEIIFDSAPTGIEGFVIKLAPWTILLVLVARAYRIINSGAPLV